MAPKGNKYALGNNGGKPPYYDNPEVLESKVNEYFNDCIKTKQHPKITGLTLYLGFCELKSLDDYEKKEEFVHIIKRSRLAVQLSYEQLLISNNATGAIFALKNMGWSDRQITELTGKDGKDLIPELNNLSPEELKQLLALKAKTGA